MKKFLIPLLLVIFSSFGLKALFHPGLYTAHDIWHQVARFYHYQKAISDGQFPPYWISNLASGLGYPLFFFSYHLPWLVGLSFLRIGFDIPTTIKILFFLSYLLSGLFMYFFTKELFGSHLASLTSSVVYLWSPYHFSTILVSAAMGTAFVFMFIPLLFWGLYKIAKRKNNLGVILIGIGLAGIILSHSITLASLLSFIFLFTIWLIFYTNEKLTTMVNLVKGLILGFLLSAFYVLPAFTYSKLTHAPIIFGKIYSQNFVYLNELIYSRWGYGIEKGTFSTQIGIVVWLAVLLTSLILFIYLNKRSFIKNKLVSLSFILLFGFFISVFTMLPPSKPIWDFASQFVTLDFPTMFLLPATFIGSLLVGWIVAYVKMPLRAVLFVLFLSTTLYTNRNHLRVNMYTDFPVSLYIESEITTNSFHEYLPRWANIKLFDQPNPLVIPEIQTTNLQQDSKQLSFLLTAPTESEVSIRQFAFAGLTLYIDEARQDFGIDKNGLIHFLITQGKHKILIRFEETLLIRISKIAAVLGVLYLLFLLKNIYAKKAQI